jgi:hypothetical protein
MNLHRNAHRRNAGFVLFPLYELQITCALVLIIAVIIGVGIYRYYMPIRRQVACAENLVRISCGSAEKTVSCPLSGEPYRIVKRDGQEVLSCPNPEKHSKVHPQFIRVGGVWRLFPVAPPFKDVGEQPVPLDTGTWTQTAAITKNKGRIVIETRLKTWFPYAICILGILIFIGIVVRAISEFKGEPGCLTVWILFWLLLLLVIGAWLTSGRRIRMEARLAEIKFEKTYLFGAYSRHAVLSPVKAVFHGSGALKATTLDQGEPTTETLVPIDEKDAGVVGLIAKTIFGPSPKTRKPAPF